MAKEKILIVEDEGGSRTLVAQVLEKADYQVFQATDGEEALFIMESIFMPRLSKTRPAPPMDEI